MVFVRSPGSDGLTCLTNNMVSVSQIDVDKITLPSSSLPTLHIYIYILTARETVEETVTLHLMKHTFSVIHLFLIFWTFGRNHKPFTVIRQTLRISAFKRCARQKKMPSNFLNYKTMSKVLEVMTTLFNRPPFSAAVSSLWRQTKWLSKSSNHQSIINKSHSHPKVSTEQCTFECPFVKPLYQRESDLQCSNNKSVHTRVGEVTIPAVMLRLFRF